MSRLRQLYDLLGRVTEAIDEELRRTARIQCLSDELVLPYEDPDDLQPCGTEAAHKRHRAHGEAPCQACREAHSEYEAGRRKSDRLTRS